MNTIWRMVALFTILLVLFTGIYRSWRHAPLSQNDIILSKGLAGVTKVEVIERKGQLPAFALSGGEAASFVKNMRMQDGKTQLFTSVGPTTFFKFYQGTKLVADAGLIHNPHDPWCITYQEHFFIKGKYVRSQGYDIMILHPTTKKYLERLLAAHKPKANKPNSKSKS